jgi:ethanolaminephosphotransferase
MTTTHKKDYDGHEELIWLFEPSIPQGHNVLTNAGADNIAHHKYKGGSSTALDTFFSPNLWDPLTNALPMWLAPNLITTIGGFFCLMSFLVSSFILPGITEGVVELPRWLFAFNGICLAIYYTLDCCDGKQARRTNSSSPLGQLFDHGMDCLCNLSHLQLAQCILENPPHLALILQAILQFSFWQAQWEEYYTGILPHAAGNFGVTEVNYGIAAWSIFTAIVGRDFYDVSIMEANSHLEWLTGEQQNLQIKHVASLGWVFALITLIVLSVMRVYKHLMAKSDDPKRMRVVFSAMSKFASPFLLGVVSIWGLTDSIKSSEVAGSLSMGLCLCLITIKLIVYSMARMAYASIQPDILPLIAVVIWAKVYSVDNAIIFQLLDLLYLARLMYWIHQAITQLCERLNVQLFRIPDKKQE